MEDVEALWDTLRQSAEPAVVASMKDLVETGSDRALNRLNPLAFAAAQRLGEDAIIGALLHASRIGLFDLSWNMLCPGCGGVIGSGYALKALDRSEYLCSFCAMSSEPTLDDLVEVSFTVNPRVRHISAHDPDALPLVEYMRQVFWGSGIDLPDDIEEVIGRMTLDVMELPGGERASTSHALSPGFYIVFDPVTHTTQFLEVSGEETTERRSLSVVFNDVHAHKGTLPMRPGPVRITFDNKSAKRTMPGIWISGDPMHELLGRRRPFLTASRLLSNQTFRDLYRTGTLNTDQRFKITNLTILFTDLEGSTALYDRVGDLVAFDLVRDHFAALLTSIAAEGGAVVKTIGDAVMATFPTPDQAMRAALRMRAAMRDLNEAVGREDLALNIGLHGGPCLAVMLDERQDYFGQTVNVASRVQGLADPSAILATKSIVESANVGRILAEAGFTTTARQSSLRGVSEAVTVYEIRQAS
jgi:class 3 adenylate cyclase